MYNGVINMSEFEMTRSNGMDEIVRQIRQDFDNQVKQEVMYIVNKKYGIDVNEEELIKALKYDREQYDKGYADGRRDARKHGEWLVAYTDAIGQQRLACSLCGFPTWDDDYAFCPNCGATMRDEDE